MRLLVWVFVVVTLAVTLAIVQKLFNPPKRHLRMAAGPEGTAEYLLAERYRTELARNGVRLEVVTTQGMLDNLARLEDGASGVDIALVEGGTTTAGASPELVSLGTLYYRPVWVFYRGKLPAPGQPWPPALRIALGPEGRNPRDLAQRLLTDMGVYPDSSRLLTLEPAAAADALVGGDADVAAIVAPWESPSVHTLLLADSVHLAGFPRAEARVAMHPELTRLMLPEGVADLARNLPPADAPLVAPKVSMAVRRSLHPALQYLLLDAASEIHGGPGIFQSAGRFPAAEPGDLPLSRPAVSYHKSGAPFLQQHLPFWVAVVLTQTGLLLLPVFGVAYPLLRGAPAAYGWWMRRRVNRLYGDLKLLEVAIAEGKAGDPAELLARLDALDARASHLQTTRGFFQMVYTLRQHIQLIRDRLKSA